MQVKRVVDYNGCSDFDDITMVMLVSCYKLFKGKDGLLWAMNVYMSENGCETRKAYLLTQVHVL